MNALMRPARATIAAVALLSFSLSASAQPAPNKPGILTVGASRGGVIQSILVQNGEHVEKGQVLAQLECRPFEKKIEARTALRAAAQAAFERVRNGPRPEEVEIGEAEVGVAEARADEARATLGRADALQPNVTISRAELQAVQRSSRVAEALLEQARKRLTLLRAGSRAEDVAEAKARLAAATASLDQASVELDECSVRAPAAGAVQLIATLGQYVSIYAPTPIALITSDAADK
jgi:multidrug resistance efflux pump